MRVNGMMGARGSAETGGGARPFFPGASSPGGADWARGDRGLVGSRVALCAEAEQGRRRHPGPGTRWDRRREAPGTASAWPSGASARDAREDAERQESPPSVGTPEEGHRGCVWLTLFFSPSGFEHPRLTLLTSLRCRHRCGRISWRRWGRGTQQDLGTAVPSPWSPPTAPSDLRETNTQPGIRRPTRRPSGRV